MSVSVPSVPVHPAREEDLPPEAGDLLHALATDPEGVVVARDEVRGVVLGLAAVVARGDVLSLVHLDVTRAARGKGVGVALFSAVRAYGASRGTRRLAFAREADDATLGFLLGEGLPVRGLALRLRARSFPPGDAAIPLSPLVAGAPLSGWVAALDRETRGFSRTADWSWWMRHGTEAFAARRGGRPEGVGAMRLDGRQAFLGPVEADTPAAAAALLIALAAEARRRGASEILITLPAEARLLLTEALRAGFRLAGTFPILAGPAPGDLRRYAASPTAFF